MTQNSYNLGMSKKKSGTERSELPINPPVLLFVIAVLLLLCGLLASPNALSTIGPMSRSLSSEIPTVRHTALLTVKVLKIIFLFSFAGSVVMILLWGKLRKSTFIRTIMEHQPLLSWQPLRIDSLLNPSFIVVGVVTLTSILYVAVGNHLFGRTTTYLINREDGVIEQATAFTFLACTSS